VAWTRGKRSGDVGTGDRPAQVSEGSGADLDSSEASGAELDWSEGSGAD